MTTARTHNVERPGYINRAELLGYVVSASAADDDDYPAQVEVQIGIWNPSGKEPLVLPVIFVGPSPEFLQTALRSQGRWVRATGRVVTDRATGKSQRWFLGKEIQYLDFDHGPVRGHGAPYVNDVTLRGFVATPPTRYQDEGYPLQLKLQVGIWMLGGREPMIQPVIFLDPTESLLKEAMVPEGETVHVTGSMAGGVIDGEWEIHVLGLTARFTVPAERPLNPRY